MSKRILSLVLTLALVLGSFSMAFADHAEGTLTPEEKIDRLVEMGFVRGKDVGGSDLDLESPIKRSETATIVSKALISGGDKDMDAVEKEIERSRYTSRFSDVPVSQWYNPYVNVAVQEAVVSGYPDGTFRPDRDIKYSEVITMMVRVLEETPIAGIGYPDNYIGKARQLGILDDINVDYTGKAQRQGVFELLYNTLTSKGIGNYNIDKVLVLENNRVESIGENEIVVEVIKEVQRANFVSGSRDPQERRGDQLKITVDNDKVGEVEDLLGKVVDLTYDAKNKAIAVKLDDSYEYVSGKVELDSKSAKVNGKSYTVLKEEQYQNDDERIFNTYINNEDFAYDKAYKDNPKLDFANVTIKNGKVIFIDGFAFDDIAPVKEVNKDGKEITVYNDMNDGGEKKIELDKETVVSFDGSFHRMDKKDIKKLDVIHVATDSKGNKAVVVRQDAQVNGKYDKVVEYRNETVVVVDGKEYEILDVDYKRPVYSADSKEFRTLHSKYASSDLKGFKDEKVTLLRDVNGDLQYIGAEVEFGEFVGLIDRVVGKEARVLKRDNTKADYTATLDSKLGDLSTGHKNLQSYTRGDLVFVSADKEEIDTMELLSPYNEKGSEVTIDKGLKYVTQGNVDYRVFDRTNVFVRNNNGEEIYATTLENIEKNATGTLTAKIITDFDYSQVDPRFNYDKSTNIINTIVFTDIEIEKDLNYKKAEITSISNRYEQIDVRYADGSTATFDINKDSKAYDALSRLNDRVQVGDIVDLGTLKTDSKVLDTITRLIRVTDQGKAIESYNPRTKELKLANDSRTYFLTSETANFVKGSLEKGMPVAIYTDGSSFVEAIATRSLEAGQEQTRILDKAVETDNKTILTIDGQLYQYAGPLSDVSGLVGKAITFKSQTLNGVNYIYDIKLADGEVVDPDPEEKTVEGVVETDMNGDTIVIKDIDPSKVNKVTFNGKELNKDNYEYGFEGTDLRIAVNEEINEVVVTIDNEPYKVVIK